MKINLGCGGFYKKGYLNIDAYNKTVADKIMSAFDLKIKENTVEEILASQLIEHLGIIGSIYCISECFRILKPGGKLAIETPDINTIFKKYLDGNYETRKNLIPWIFGVDTPGMIHRFCFPEDLLEEILKDNGFIKIKKEFYEIDEYEPVLKIVCEKTKNYKPFQIVCNLRKKLLKNKLIDLNNQITSIEIEFLIKIFPEQINRLLKNQRIKQLEEIIIQSSIKNPKITLILLEELIRNKITSRKQIENYTNVVSELDKLDFTNILCYSMRQIPGFIGEQKRLLQTITDMGRAIIKNLLDESKRQSTIKSLNVTKKHLTNVDKIGFFSEKLLILKSNKFFQQGAKYFIQKKYDKAVKKFKLSIYFNRDQILSYWNLARIYNITDNKSKAEKYYNDTKDILNQLEIKNKDIIKKKIDREKSGIKIDEPLFSLNDVF